MGAAWRPHLLENSLTNVISPSSFILYPSSFILHPLSIMTKVAIIGYGNIGKAVEQAVLAAEDMTLSGIYHHNDSLIKEVLSPENTGEAPRRGLRTQGGTSQKVGHVSPAVKRACALIIHNS